MSWVPAQAFADMSHGDKDAEAFMGVLYCWFHKQDDLIDRDKIVPADITAGFDFHVLRAFAKNPFFQKHQDFLLPVLLTSALAWIASEDRRQSPDVVERITAQVLKSQYLDVFLAASFCVAGFNHAVAMSRKYREYAFDVEPVSKDNGLRLATEAKIGQTG